MTRKERIQWSVITVEGIAIVISILLAFAIDAWWEENRERETESLALSLLVKEFRQNLQQLEQTREGHTDALNATEQLLSMVAPDDGSPPDTQTVAPLLVSCLTNHTFDPRLGTLESLIASGNLQLLRDLELQSMLTEWPTAMMNMLQWQQIERENTEQFMLPYTYDFVSYSNILAALNPGDEKYNLGDFQPGPFSSDFGKLFASLRFEGMLNSRRINLRELIEQSHRLEENAAAILERLEQQSP